MKIKELHLRNIASIEKADIDFENSLHDGITGEPAGIFLIAGDTGAGKSVILDGIAMALYKKTPRIVGVANTNKNNFNNEEGENIKVNSIEQYTRLGISVNDECYSEVVFTGNDGKEYHARLSLGIYRGRTDKETGLRPIRYRDPLWEVKIGENDWTKVDNDGQPILNAVGLTFEQFGRMAMLAQGQFASFLTGDKKERESILEQLTNTAHFTQYGNAIKSLFDKAKASKNEAQMAYDTEKQHILSPEEYNQYETEYKEKSQSKAELEKKKAFDEEQLKHVTDIEKLQKTKSEAQLEVKVQEEIIAGSIYRNKKDLILLWDKTVEQRLWLNEWKSQQIQVEKTLAEMVQSQRTFTTLSADFQQRKEEQQVLDGRLSQSKEWLEERKEKDSLYTHAGEYKLKLESLIANQKAISDKVDSIQKLEADKPSLHTALNEAIAKADEAKKAVDKQQGAIEQLTKEREQLNPTQIANDIEQTNKRK
ncbi:MAG: SMC family ATPase, partial [Bacteroidaceae bacterium]|nr:SMC family ATPase [Bacteroidaceae bacterium]